MTARRQRQAGARISRPAPARGPLRIATLSTPLIAAGGAERQFFEETKAMRARGHAVLMLTFRLRDEALFVPGISARDIKMVPSKRGWPGQILALRRVLQRARPDLLVSHTSPELTWLATRGTGVPYVQYHNSPPFYIGPEANPYMMSARYRRVFSSVRDDVAGYADLERTTMRRSGRSIEPELRTALKHRALRDARAVIVPSQRTVRELRLLHGVEATVVRGCLAPGATAVPRPVSGAPIVLSVCRLEPVKRVDLLLRAFAVVLVEMPDARLVIAGTGSQTAPLRALASSLGIDRSVEFSGYVPDSEVAALYKAARVFAAPAMADFNIAPYEALAAGCNVVWTTEMETDPEIEASGRVFVAHPDVQPLASALLAAVRAPASAPVDLSSMTWPARARKLEAIYARVVAECAA